MRRTAAGLTILFLALAVPGTAVASQPVTQTFDTSSSFTDDELSAACGFEVVVSREGQTLVTLFYNQDGLVARETDSAVGTKITYSAPSTGRSFSYPRTLIASYDYGAGAVVGSDVTVKVTGSLENFPGTTPFAGQIIAPGVVVGFSDGLPLVDITGDPLADNGSRSEADVDAICAALA